MSLARNFYFIFFFFFSFLNSSFFFFLNTTISSPIPVVMFEILVVREWLQKAVGDNR